MRDFLTERDTDGATFNSTIKPSHLQDILNLQIEVRYERNFLNMKIFS